MRIYESIHEFTTAEHAPASGNPEPIAPEEDWGYRLRGAGLTGGTNGWHLTYLHHDDPGLLIAYEISNNKKTGRIALLRRNWTRAYNDHWKHHTQTSTHWTPTTRDTTGEADIDHIDTAIAGPTIH
jgi:hypothetical protein